MRFPALFLCFMILFTSCSDPDKKIKGSGTIAQEERKVTPFTRIELRGLGKLVLQQSENESVVIETDDNLLQYITVAVNGESLVLDTIRNIQLSPSKDVIFNVNFKNLTKLDLSGASSVSNSKQIVLKDLDIVMQGASFGDLDLSLNALNLKASGSGSITIKGEANSEVITLLGAGNFHGFDFPVKTAKVKVEGVGSANINAKDHLDVEIAGVGSVNYMGSPEIKQKISGVGAIHHKE